MAAYMRISAETGPTEEAVAEVRRYGHNWTKYSDNGGDSSWHEARLRAIAKSLKVSSE